MRHYPLFMDLKERRALVVGSGEVAERKAEALRRCGALVDIHPAFDPRALDGCALAIGAEAPEADLRALSAEARARGIPVNIVDLGLVYECDVIKNDDATRNVDIKMTLTKGSPGRFTDNGKSSRQDFIKRFSLQSFFLH